MLFTKYIMFSKLEWKSVFDINYIFKNKVFYFVLGIKFNLQY